MPIKKYCFRKLTFKLIVLFVGSFLLTQVGVQAQIVVSTGTNFKISHGTFSTITQNLVVESGAGLTIEGSLILKNNLTNQNAEDDLGSGTIAFSGITPQSISGRNTFGSLVVNNTTGLDMNGNTMLNTGLALQNGSIRLGTNNLTLGSTASITGTPSAASMVIATGTGELRKSFSGTGAFTFPVGDNTGTAEYTPVILTFTSGTFAAGNYAGVKLSNSAYTGLSGNYLNRYWTLTQSGITATQYNTLFQYVPADVFGIETSLSSVQLEPSPAIAYNPADALRHQLTANGVTTFGIFSGFSKFVQEILLNNGWNIVSSYVTPVNLNLKDLFQSLIDAGKLKKVMDESGKTIENFGAFGGWKNNIGNLNSAKGYKVNVLSESTLSLEGTPVPLPFELALATGWNIISYPSATAQEAKALVQSLIDAGKLKKVMDEAGKTIENFGAFGGWKNNIGNFLPGKGYKVNVLENCTLTIPANGTKSAVVISDLLASEHFKKVFSGNGTDHASINLVNLQASGLQAGDEIGVFDGKLCVGSAMIGSDQLIAGSISIPASANDGLGESPNGFVVGNRVSVKLYRESLTYPLTLTKLEGQDIFDKNASLFAQVSIAGATGINDFDNEISFRCYPNPFNEQITIEIQSDRSEKLEVNIYTMDGKLVRKLYEDQTKNSITLIWNGRNETGIRVVPGTYLIKANDRIEKIVCME